MPEVYVSPPAPIKGVRTTQPQTPVRLTNIFAVDFATVPSFPPGTFSGGTVLGINRVGRSYSFPTLGSTTSWVSFGNSAQDIFWLSPGWALFVLIPTASGSYYIANKSDNNGQQGWSLYESGSGAFEMKYIQSGNTTVSSVAGALTLNAVNVVLVNFNGNPYLSGTTKLYVNGLDVTGLYSSVGTTGHDSDAPQPLRLGYGAFGASNSFVGSINLAAFGRKWLSDAEIRSLSANPWQLFMPAQGRVFVPQVSDQTPSIAPKQPTTPRQSQMMGTAGVGVAGVTHNLAKGLIRTKQPTGASTVDLTNPITRGLEFLWSAATPNLEIIKRKFGTLISGDSLPIRDQDSAGVAVRGGGGAARRRIVWSGAPYKSSTEYTVATFCMKEATAGNPFDSDDVYGTRMFQLSYDNFHFIVFDTATANYGAPNPSTVVEFEAQLYAGRVKANQATAWIDGVSGSPVTVTGTVQGCTSNSTFSIGAFATSNGGAYYGSGFDGKIYMCAYWARALTDTELKALSANPWQIFAPDNRKIWVPT